MRISPALSCLLAAGLLTAPPLHGQQEAEREVLATVQRLFDAMRTKDTAAFRTIFEAGARLVGMRTRANGEVFMQTLTWERFAEVAARSTAGEWIERVWNPEVRIRGTLATVWADYDFHFGERFSHCGVARCSSSRLPRDGGSFPSRTSTSRKAAPTGRHRAADRRPAAPGPSSDAQVNVDETRTASRRGRPQ
jgi:hypothetical protein